MPTPALPATACAIAADPADLALRRICRIAGPRGFSAGLRGFSAGPRGLLLFLLAATMLMLLPAEAAAQSLRDRIEDRNRRLAQQAREEARQVEEEPQARSIASRMHDIIEDVQIRNAPARDVLKWWSTSTGISMVVNWNRLADQGVNPDALINLEMRSVPVHRVLQFVIDQMSDEVVPLTYETTAWYVQVVTQEQADRNVVRRVYPVEDLIFEVPNFTNAPRMGLSDALQGGGSGGERDSSEGIFGDDEENDDEQDTLSSKAQRGEELAQLVRDTITPHLWRAHGGEFSSIKYMRGMLIVTAPVYVHQQIGGGMGLGPRTSLGSTSVTPAAAKAVPRADGVAGVQSPSTSATSSVAR